MRNRDVPQTAHLPLVAGVPVLVIVGWASTIARVSLHFTQYACNDSVMVLPQSWATLRGNEPLLQIFIVLIGQQSVDHFLNILRAVFMANEQGIFSFDDNQIFNADG